MQIDLNKFSDRFTTFLIYYQNSYCLNSGTIDVKYIDITTIYVNSCPIFEDYQNIC